jgi:hypothetical protein
MGEPPIPTPSGLDTAAVREYVERLLHTERFRKAPNLRHLLEYLVTKTAEGRLDEIKESVIAIDVFGRSQEFDGRLDNTVRVQAHRLRKLLESYYAAEGAADTLRISIPKGSYTAQVSQEPQAAEPELAVGAELGAGPEFVPAPQRRPRLAMAAAFLGGALVALGVVALAGRFSSAPAASSGGEALRRAPLAALWGGVLQPGVNCVVSFTNPAFIWKQMPHTRLYMTYQGPISAPVGTRLEIQPDDPYLDPEISKLGGPFIFGDSWTGTGELFGVYKLTKLFAEAAFPLRIIRSRALTYDDIRGANVIFLGSGWANELQDKFHAGNAPLICDAAGRVVNRHPQAGEPAFYTSELDPTTQQVTVTYGLFSVLPGASPGTKVMISGGIDTYSTYAALDLMTSIPGLNDLLKRLDSARGRTLPEYFQAVIRAEMIRGQPFNPTLVLARAVDPGVVLPTRH